MDATLAGIAIVAVLTMACIIGLVLMKTSARAIEEDDPLIEAEVYLAHGRKHLAREVLEKALRNEPGRIDLQVKLYQLTART
jgi:Tfp pilus assembly protein FimV